MSVFTHSLATNNYGPAKFIVATSAANGTHTTLASALTAASVGDTVFLRDSVTENVTLPAGVNIACWQGGRANTPAITGTLTMTAAGTSTINGIRFITNSAAAIAITGSAASILHIFNCDLNFTNNTGITFSSSSSSAILNFYNCTGDLGTTGIGIYTHTSAGTISFINTFLGNSGGSSTASTNSSGTVGFQISGIGSPISSSSTGAVSIINSTINTSGTNSVCITLSGTAVYNIHGGILASGTASAVSVGTGCTVNFFASSSIQSTNTNAMTGAGTLNYPALTCPVGFTSASNVTSQVPEAILGGGWGFIKTLTASTSATLDFTTLPSYTAFAFVIKNLVLATNAQQLLFRISNDNGSTFAATGYTAGANYTSYNSATVTNVNATTSFPLTSAASNGAGLSGIIYCTTQNALAWGLTNYLSTTSGVQAFATVGGSGNIVPNAFRFLSSSGNLTSGAISIYGLYTG